MGREDWVQSGEPILAGTIRKVTAVITEYFGSEFSSKHVVYLASVLPVQPNQLNCLPCIEARLAVLISQS